MRRRFLFAGLCFGCLSIAVVIIQLLYPTGRLLPFVRVNGENCGNQTVSTVASRLQYAYDHAYIEVQAGGAASAASFQEVGLDAQASTTALAAGKYSLAQRLIPFSGLAIMITRDEPIHMRIDNERVHYFAEQLEKQGMIPAVNASLKVRGEDVILLPGKPKQSFPAEATYQAILKSRISPVLRVAPAPVVVSASVSDDEAVAMQLAAKQILSSTLALRIDSRDITVDKATVASWFDFPIASGHLVLDFQTDRIRQYLASAQLLAYKAPVATRITTLDGHETGRVVGANGKGIDLGAAAAQIEAHLRTQNGGVLTIGTVPLAPDTTYVRNYSDTSIGLNALLGDITAGKNYGVSVAEIGGKARSASAQGDKVYLAASTYKLFVAYSVFKQIESGDLHWNDTISGLTADVCFEKMIVNSDNPCATAFGERIGWANIQNTMHSLGLGSTSLAAGAKYTTANDLALFLTKLEQGTLLSASDRSLLLGYMKQQIYRKGIPAGTDATVADKVGFYQNVIHDAAVVYAPGQTYVVVVMTSGGSWTGIADTARQIHQYMTR